MCLVVVGGGSRDVPGGCGRGEGGSRDVPGGCGGGGGGPEMCLVVVGGGGGSRDVRMDMLSHLERNSIHPVCYRGDE